MNVISLTCAVILLSANEGRVEVDTDTDAEQVISLLQEIRDGYRSGHTGLRNIRVKGRLTPGDRKFQLTIEDGRRRYDEEHVGANGDRYFTTKIFDGVQHISINPTAMAIARPAAPEQTSWDDALSYYRYLHPHVASERSPVDRFCDYMISLTGNDNRFNRVIYRPGARLLQVSRFGTTYVIEDAGRRIPEIDGGRLRFRFVFDAAVGFNMIEAESHQGADGDPFHEIVRIESKYRQNEERLWVLESGRQIIERTGQRVTKPGQIQRTARITSVETGDFEVAHDEFVR